MASKYSKQTKKAKLDGLKRYSAALLTSVALLGMMPAEALACRWHDAKCHARKAKKKIEQAANRAREAAEHQAREAQQAAERQAREARELAERQAREAQAAAERAALEAMNAGTAVTQEMIDIAGNFMLAEKYIRAVESLFELAIHATESKQSWEDFIPTEHRNQINVFINKKDPNGGNQSGLNNETNTLATTQHAMSVHDSSPDYPDQADHDQSNAIAGLYPPEVFSEMAMISQIHAAGGTSEIDDAQDDALRDYFDPDMFSKITMVPLNTGAGGVIFIAVPSNTKPAADASTEQGETRNYGYPDRAKWIETTALGVDVKLEAAVGLREQLDGQFSVGAGLLLGGYTKINGTKSIYNIAGSRMRPSIQFELAAVLAPGSAALNLGGNVKVDFLCTVGAKCMTQAIKLQSTLNADIEAVLQEMNKKGSVSFWLAAAGKTYANAKGPTIFRAAKDKVDDVITAVTTIRPPKKQNPDEEIPSDMIGFADLFDDLVKAGDEMADAVGTAAVKTGDSSSASTAAKAVSTMVPPFMKFATLGSTRIYAATKEGMSNIDQTTFISMLQIGWALGCDMALNSRAARLKRVADALVAAGKEAPVPKAFPECINETKGDVQTSWTWYNNRWATNPNGRIDQGYYPKPGIDNADLFGINLVLNDAIGIKLKGEVTVPTPLGLVDVKVGGKVRLSNPMSMGRFWPLTYNGRLEKGEFSYDAP